MSSQILIILTSFKFPVVIPQVTALVQVIGYLVILSLVLRPEHQDTQGDSRKRSYVFKNAMNIKYVKIIALVR